MLLGLATAAVSLPPSRGLADDGDDPEPAAVGQAEAAEDAADDAAPAEDAETADVGEEGGIFLPTDRLRQRQLDRARRLIEDGRWSDAATLLDEILGADRDFFFRADQRQRTWQSIKAETSRIIGSLAPPGRDAYQLQFAGRADRQLRQAIEAGDAAAVVAVARRWFHTPAGHRATLLAAIEALESNQPLAAAAWLDRLSSADGVEPLEPTLSIMRAVAWFRAGDRQAAAAILDRASKGRRVAARIGGKDVTVSFPAGEAIAWLTALAGEASPLAGRKTSEWWLHRGDPARNAVATAARPLLVPRYRVPLTRHPEEARLLEKRRKSFADQDTPLFPAGTPLAVDGSILMHTPMGLLAVDFETGKRIWLQTGGAAGPVGGSGGDGDAGGETDAGGRRFVEGVFADATSGTLSSDGRLVFAVESDPDAVGGTSGPGPGINFRGVSPGGWKGGNSLVAYDVAAKGAVRWRLPAREAGGDAAAGATPWHLGAPLPIGEKLFVLVEEKGEIRLDVLESATGRLEWSQPLAELDEEQAIDNRDSHARRTAGLSPSLSEGVLVCPTGAGAVVAVDLATRTLLWAYHYPQPKEGDVVLLPNGVRVRRAMGGGNGGLIINGQWVDGGRSSTANRWRDSTPILVGGRVLLAPGESDELHCLDLRRGSVVWKVPRRDALQVAGVVDGKVILVGRKTVDALSLDQGRSVWPQPVKLDVASPSGRGILTGNRLFLPLDTPEVVEIDLAAGCIADRSPARGGAVPGNLLAYRGEVISQGVDSLDVFHQAAPLEDRIETALRKDARDPWALLWRGQIDLDRGRVAEGIAMVREAQAVEPRRITREVVADAIDFALRRNFAAAAPLWREAVETGDSPDATRAMLRIVVDGFLRVGDLAQAWEACSMALDRLPAAEPSDPQRPFRGTEGRPLVEDASDPRLATIEDRWLRGRIADLVARADPAVRGRIDEAANAALAAAMAVSERTGRVARLQAVIDRFGRHPSALLARERLGEELDGVLRETGTRSEAIRDVAVRREFLMLESSPDAAATPPASDLGNEWPVGRVVQRRADDGRGDGANAALRASRVMPIPVDNGLHVLVPGLRIAYDLQQPGLVATDGYGRRIGEPFAFDGAGRFDGNGLGSPFQPMGSEASAIGRVVYVRSGPLVAAFELAAGAGEKNRRLWMLSGRPDGAVQQGVALPGMGMGVGRRGGRNGMVALGVRISEPDDPSFAAAAAVGGGVRPTGIPVFANRSLAVHDPLTGAVLWERHRLPPVGDIFGDDEYLCACSADGRNAVVLSMADGRVVRTGDVPRREQRLLTCGRRIVTIGPPGDGGSQPMAQRVQLELFDPLDGGAKPLGSFSGAALATTVGADRLAVVEPGGTLTLIDAAAARTVFRTQLPEMPAVMSQLVVVPWQDRLLVFVGRPETDDERRQLEAVGMIASLPQMASGRESSQPATGSIWAVDRIAGDMLWPVPATVLRHCLHRNQPAELPVLLFVRQIQPTRGGERPRLSVLGLDKRTGHAIYADDKIVSQPHMLFGCDMAGDPEAHTITLSRTGGDTPDLKLDFTGEPMAPRPPHQSATQPPAPRDLATELEYWLQKVLTIPLPF